MESKTIYLLQHIERFTFTPLHTFLQQLPVTLIRNLVVGWPLVDLTGAPMGPNSFIFMQLPAKNRENNRFFLEMAPPPGKHPGSATDHHSKDRCFYCSDRLRSRSMFQVFVVRPPVLLCCTNSHARRIFQISNVKLHY